MTLDTVIGIMGLLIGILQFFAIKYQSTRKFFITFIGLSLLFSFIIGAIQLTKSYVEYRRVYHIAEDLYSKLKSETTFEEIYEKGFFNSFDDVNSAIDILVDMRKLKTDDRILIDNKGQEFKVKIYYK